MPIQLVLGGKSLATVQLRAAIRSLFWMGEAVEASASPHLRRVSPRFHIGTSLDSPPPGPEAGALVSSPLPPPALHLESRGGRW